MNCLVPVPNVPINIVSRTSIIATAQPIDGSISRAPNAVPIAADITVMVLSAWPGRIPNRCSTPHAPDAKPDNAPAAYPKPNVAALALALIPHFANTLTIWLATLSVILLIDALHILLQISSICPPIVENVFVAFNFLAINENIFVIPSNILSTKLVLPVTADTAIFPVK